MVMSHPAIDPGSLRPSGGYIGTKRMQWFMAHQANAVSRQRELGIIFEVLVPCQLTLATALGHAVAAAYAEVEGMSVDEHILQRYASRLQPSQIGRQVPEMLGEPRYASGVGFGFRADLDTIPRNL
jgi:hypothetical protein